MLEPKYIVYFDEVIELEEIVFFSGFQKHVDVAQSLRGPVISAGFVRFEATIYGTVDVSCYGESDSLQVASRPDEDSSIAKHRLQLEP